MPERAAAPRRFLAADDDPAIRKVLELTLRRAGYEVSVCENGSLALAALAREPFDLLLTDLSMPVLDGFGLTREAKRLKPHVPVLVMTNDATSTAIHKAFALGAEQYLVKPFRSPEVVREKVADALEAAERRSTLRGKMRAVSEIWETIGSGDSDKEEE